MTAWLLLAAAILMECGGSLSLRAAATGQSTWYIAVAAAYVASLGLFAASLHNGMVLGAAYGVWAATGVALTAIASKLLFAEIINRYMAIGIGLIAVGVFLIETGVEG
jgi:small multidrug resistance pump